jgi:hypothetical protein
MPPKGVSQIDEKNRDQWEKLITASTDDQCDAFLRAFVLDFSGDKFEEVLDVAAQFKKFTRGKIDLEEGDALRFLEARKETVTAAALREALKAIDVDNNHR